MTDVTLGQKVIVRGHSGIVRFYGSTEFAPGEWVGIELDTPQGRNNGTVQGVKYFDCKNPGDHGIFVRPALLNDSSSENKNFFVTSVVNKLQTKLKTAMDEISKYRGTVTGLEAEIAKYKLLAEDLETSLEKATINEDQLQSYNEALLNDLDLLKQKFEELQHDHSLLREELDLHKDLEEAIKSQEVDDAVSKEDFMVLVQNNKRLEVAISSVKKISAETEAKLKSQISQLEEQLSKSAAAQTSVDILQKQLAVSENVAQSLQEQLENNSDVDRIIEHLTIENEELQNTVKELTQSVKEFSELHQLEKSIGDSQFAVEDKLKHEIDALLKEAHQNKLEIQRLQSINEKLSAESKTAHQSLSEIKNNYRENEMEVLRLEVRKSKAKILGLNLTNSFLETYSGAITRLQKQLVTDDFISHFEIILQLKMIISYCLVIIAHMTESQHSSSTLRSVSLLRRLHCTAEFISLVLKHDANGDIDSISLNDRVTSVIRDIKTVMTRCQEGDFENLDLSFVSHFTEKTNEILPQDKVGNLDKTIINFTSVIEELESCKLNLIFAQTQYIRAIGAKQPIKKEIFDIMESFMTLLRSMITQLEGSVFNLTSEVHVENSYLSAFNDRLILFLQKCEDLSDSDPSSVTSYLAEFEIDFDKLLSYLQDISSRVPSEVVFGKETLKSIFSPVSSNEVDPKKRLCKEDSSLLHSKVLEKEQKLKELSMQLELLEKNSNLSLKGKQEELETVQKLNSELQSELKDLKEQLEEQINEKTALVVELNSFDKKALDAMFFQVPALQSINEKKKYVSEMVIIDEINLLREMVNLSTSAGGTEEYEWLKKPLIKRSGHNLNTNHKFLSLANQKKREAIAMSRQKFSLRQRF